MTPEEIIDQFKLGRSKCSLVEQVYMQMRERAHSERLKNKGRKPCAGSLQRVTKAEAQGAVEQALLDDFKKQ